MLLLAKIVKSPENEIKSFKLKNVKIKQIYDFNTLYLSFNIPSIIYNNILYVILHNNLVQININNMQIINIEPLNIIFNNVVNTIISGNFIVINNILYFFGSLDKSGGIILNCKNKTYQHFTHGIVNVSQINDNIGVLNEVNEFLILNHNFIVINKHANQYTKTINIIQPSYAFNNHYIYFNINNQCIILNQEFTIIKIYDFNCEGINYVEKYDDYIIIADDNGIYKIDMDFNLITLLKKPFTNILNKNNKLLATYQNELYEIDISDYSIIQTHTFKFVPIKIKYINDEFILIIHTDQFGSYTLNIYNIKSKKLYNTNEIFNSKYDIISTLFKNRILHILYLNNQNVLEYIEIKL